MKLNINDEIIGKLQKRVDETDEFNNVEEYLEFVLKQVVDKLETKKESSFSKEDEDKVKEKLRGLGYLK